MKTMQTTLVEEKRQLEKIVKETRGRLKNAPEGHLRISKKHDGTEYYYKSADNHNRNARYMKKSEINLARRLAQRDYDKRVEACATEKIKVIEKFLQKYEKADLKKLYEGMSLQRRELFTPVMISDEEYVKQWQEVKYVGKSFLDDTTMIVTEKGERVRSKSEKIIADKLYALKIPYRYEYPLTLDGSIKVYPDFTILRMPQREEVYLEHFGMMDDAGYVETVMAKLNTYGKNGIYPGINLFITYESKRYPLDTKTLSSFLKRTFCVE